MTITKIASIVIFCLLFLRQVKGEEEDSDGNRVWNFFFGGNESGKPYTYNCPEKQLTCETRNASVAYVHWGRDDCNPATSDIVYSGYVGGGNFAQTGAGTNALCLPESPEYDEELVVAGGSRSFLYGAEFETENYNPLHELYQTDPLCAVCLARGRSTTLMIPAKHTCPEGWTREYDGLLMGSHQSQPAGHEYVCFDKNSEGRHGSRSNDNGMLFYPVHGSCGSLPCPPYVEGSALSCIVCSR